MRTIASLLFCLALVAAACGEETPAAVDAGAATDLAATTTAPPATTVPPTTTAVPATTMAMEMGHDADEAGHDEDMGHDDGEKEHDEGMGHDDEEKEHDDGMGEGADPDEFDREIEVVMAEFAFDPATIEVQAGETVRFTLVNDGAVPHEFRLTTAHAAAEHIASGHEGHGDDDGEAGHGHDEVVLEVAAGATDTLTVTFDEHMEFDQIACLIPGHYEAGMLGDLEIAT